MSERGRHFILSVPALNVKGQLLFFAPTLLMKIMLDELFGVKLLIKSNRLPGKGYGNLGVKALM
jgi:hypothetical protein